MKSEKSKLKVKNPKPKLIVILGQTATGKSKLGVRLAKRFNGEVISADSRQVYKGMDIGTGKITEKEMQGVPHHLLDVVSPKRKFSVAEYQKLTFGAIDGILTRGNIPFLVGGSPFYIYSVIEGWEFPKLKNNWQLRKKLEKKTAAELFKILNKLDLKRTKNIDSKNKRRLIRAIEICKQMGRVPKLRKNPKYDCLLIGVKKAQEELNELIKKRLEKRLKQGMIAEVKRLKNQGLSWKKLDDFGLEYRWIARFLQKKISRQEMILTLRRDIEKFAKRQMTWFKKDKRIKWIKKQKQAEFLVRKFL